MTVPLPTADEPARVIHADVLAGLAALPDGCVQCCVTSPPYWGAQRDYGMAAQLGMEKRPEEFVAALLGVFREVRRVLRPDGVLWLNIGDSYAASGKGGGGSMMLARGHQWGHRKHLKGWRSPPPGYKQKDLVGVPWRLAFALQADGWTLRRDVVWNKGSATEPPRADRPAGSHEFVFLFSQGIRYQFDATALPHGSVWTVQPQGHEGHGAAFPPDLIRPMVLAGSRPGDIVLDCFAGSGTTLDVAVRCGRRALGIELNPRYVDVCEKRLAEPLGIGGLFDDGSRPTVSLFDGGPE